MARRGTTPPAYGKPTGSNCPTCGASEVWGKAKTGHLFEACTRYTVDCPRNPANAGKPAPAPAPTRAPAPTGGDLGTALAGALMPQIAALVASMVAEKLAEAGPVTVRHEWAGPDTGTQAAFEGDAHPALDRIIRRIQAGFNNLLLVGPAGSGKTTIADQLAQAFNNADETFPREAAIVCVSGGTSESTIVGRKIPNLTGGESVYEATEFVNAFEGGGVILLDEFDGMDPNVALVINAALANGYMMTPRGKVRRHARCYILAAANTWGMGGDMQYVGRNQLDAATLDRFVGATFLVDYNRELEAKIVPEENLRRLIWGMRERAEASKVRRVIGMRMLIAAAKLWRAGDGLDEIKAAITVGWKPEEVSRVCP